MNVLSLFDGMSCGMIALERAGVKVSNYYSSEIDKFAIQVSEANYPQIKRLGDVQTINYQLLPKIDLLIGGSPCQGFSMAGKQLNFSDPRSALFFEFVAALKELKPTYFLLENVRMKKSIQDEISRLLGCEPIRINSNLVSAQDRKRLYWTNLPGIEQPNNKEIMLIDIIDHDGEFTYMSDKFINRQKGRKCLRDDLSGKAVNLSAMEYVKNGRQGDYIKCVNENSRVNAISENDRGYRPHKNDDRKSGISELGRILKDSADKSETLTKSHMPKLAVNSDIEDLRYRKLTPIECERLQTVPDNYTNHVSNTQRYKMLGNGWTVDVIAHIFKNLGDSNGDD